MRLLFAISLFICFPFCKGQTVIDSIINTTWVDDFNWKLEFDDNDTLTISGQWITQSQFFINDTIIGWKHPTDTFSSMVEYKYFTDSLELYPIYGYPLWAWQCNIEDFKSNNQHWTFYREDYLDGKSFDFVKIRMRRNGIIEVDNKGNILYEARGHRDYYGHYRGKLSENQLEELLNLMDEEQLRITRLMTCGDSKRWGAEGPPLSLKYRINSKTYTGKGYLGGFKTVDFIYDNVKIDELEFQNYADGDSVKGVTIFKLNYSGLHLYEVNQTIYLGQYEDEGKKYYLYKCHVDSVCTPRDSFTLSNHSQNLMYFYSDTLLKAEKRILIETAYVENYWFNRGRAFHRPPGLIFRKLISHKEFPENYKLVVKGGYRGREQIIPMLLRYEGRENEYFPNPFPKPYRTRFGLPYPFLRPDFQVVFEEYVLPDWEEYLESQKSDKKK